MEGGSAGGVVEGDPFQVCGGKGLREHVSLPQAFEAGLADDAYFAAEGDDEMLPAGSFCKAICLAFHQRKADD
jgi:hypothetical protein